MESRQTIVEKPVSKAEQKLWDEAQKDMKVETYNLYLQMHPAGKYAETARQIIQFLKSQQDSKRESQEQTALRGLIKPTIHPPTRNYVLHLKSFLRQETETEKKDREVWQAASHLGTEGAYNDYLSKYPKGRYIYTASRAIQQLHFTYYKKGAWWLLLIGITALSFLGCFLGELLYRYILFRLDPQIFIPRQIPMLLSVLVGIVWGLIYGLTDMGYAVNMSECVERVFKPFAKVFSADDFREFRIGLFAMPFVNNLLILAALALLQFLIHYVGWLMNLWVMAIGFAALHIIAMISFATDD